jgi:16S rRNA (guanine527-N7)-methyltransferase
MFHVKHSLDVQNICRKNGLELSDGQWELMDRYVALMLEWNKKVNLISRKDEENVWTAHILHSLSPLFRVRLPAILKVLDLGSGGGLPGLPLAIANEGWSVVLMDSIQKKCAAMEDMVDRLGLSGRVRVVCGRAEEKGEGEKLRGGMDVVLARGVASMSLLVKWGKPYLKRSAHSGGVAESGGEFVVTPPVLAAYKGGDLDMEFREMKVKARAEAAALVSLAFAGSDEAGLLEKKLVIIVS